MHEIELKLQIPVHQFESIHQAFLTQKSKKIDLHARYFDTKNSSLAQHLMAIRIRKEGDQWIQTLKSAGESHLQRFEHEFNLGSTKKIPKLNLDIYKDHPEARKLLNGALGDDWNHLRPQFETIVQRYYHIVSLNGSKIEVCLDLGTVKSRHRQMPIQEVEFELKSGNLSDLILLSSQWVERYEIWLDVRSKAERGHLLAKNKVVSEPTVAKAVHLESSFSTDQALKKIIANCLEHLLPNVAAICEQIATPEHIQHTHTALTHLAYSLKYFEKWSDHPVKPWKKQIKTLISQMNNLLDPLLIQQDILPRLKHGRISIASHTSDANRLLAQVFQHPFTTQLWLDLLNFSYTSSNQVNKNTQDLQHNAEQFFEKLQMKISQKATQYTRLTSNKKIKLYQNVDALSFGLSCFANLCPNYTNTDVVKQVNDVQAQLKQSQNLNIALRYFKANKLDTTPLGILQKDQKQTEQRTEKMLKLLNK